MNERFCNNGSSRKCQRKELVDDNSSSNVDNNDHNGNCERKQKCHQEWKTRGEGGRRGGRGGSNTPVI